MNKNLKVLILLLPGLGLIIIFVGIVFIMAAAQSFGFFDFTGESTFSTGYWTLVLSSRIFWKSFFYSFRIALLGSVLSVMLAYPIALWLRKPFKGSAFIAALIKIPMLIPGLVAAFLYVNFVSYSGFLNYGLVSLGLVPEPLRMQNDPWGVGVVILQVWKNMPFALLLLTGSVRSIGDDIIAAARDLGAGIWARFRKIIAPLTLRALQAALVIIFIGAAGDYSFQVIAGPVKLSSLAQLMYRYQNQMGEWNSSAVVAVMLMLLSLIGSAVLALFMQILIKAGEK